jgi:hypothetical protein
VPHVTSLLSLHLQVNEHSCVLGDMIKVGGQAAGDSHLT